jgi:hypothetical protein
MDIEKRLGAIEKRLVILEDSHGLTHEKLSVLEMDLILPEAYIEGLHFNETNVHAVFELKEDGWYYSRDILFLSARKAEDNNDRDDLTEYLKSQNVKDVFIDAITDAKIVFNDIELSLPEENQGIKKYNGVSCCYWLSATHYFCLVLTSGAAYTISSNNVYGVAPCFLCR